MIDLLSVSISGALTVGRARVLWQDGILKVWGIDGHLVSLNSERPTRRRGHLAQWQANTESGEITIRGKCIGCGGSRWWKLLRVNRDELWSRA